MGRGKGTGMGKGLELQPSTSSEAFGLKPTSRCPRSPHPPRSLRNALPLSPYRERGQQVRRSLVSASAASQVFLDGLEHLVQVVQHSLVGESKDDQRG